MDLLQLKYFCDAAKTENFSKTAAKHLVPPSNISQTVSRLERELGVRLFDRGGNAVKLNSEGVSFYQKVSRALALIDEACAEATDGTLGNREINLVVSSNRRIVTEAIDIFRREHPTVSFNISHRSGDIDETTDIIVSDDRVLKSKYCSVPLIEEKILLAVNDGSTLAKKSKITTEDLSCERFIFLNEGSSLNRVSRSVLNNLGVGANVVIRVDDPYYLRKYVALGLGVALTPEFSFRGQWEAGVTLREIGDFYRTTFLFSKREGYLSAAAREFAALLTRLVKNVVSTPQE
ncbi:MAG: LysR family transcriptional regulator [Clostridia bacterium]|nr:LysR family transcriptional regulator [Clostridia bacterium]